MSHPSAAWTQFFSTVISGGADDIKQSDGILVFRMKILLSEEKKWHKNRENNINKINVGKKWGKLTRNTDVEYFNLIFLNKKNGKYYVPMQIL